MNAQTKITRFTKLAIDNGLMFVDIGVASESSQRELAQKTVKACLRIDCDTLEVLQNGLVAFIVAARESLTPKGKLPKLADFPSKTAYEKALIAYSKRKVDYDRRSKQIGRYLEYVGDAVSETIPDNVVKFTAKKENKKWRVLVEHATQCSPQANGKQDTARDPKAGNPSNNGNDSQSANPQPEKQVETFQEQIERNPETAFKSAIRVMASKGYSVKRITELLSTTLAQKGTQRLLDNAPKLVSTEQAKDNDAYKRNEAKKLAKRQSNLSKQANAKIKTKQADLGVIVDPSLLEGVARDVQNAVKCSKVKKDSLDKLAAKYARKARKVA